MITGTINYYCDVLPFWTFLLVPQLHPLHQ